MSDWFENNSPFAAFHIIPSGNINNKFKDIEDSFKLLPAPNPQGSPDGLGFKEPLAVADAVKSNQAASAGQVSKLSLAVDSGVANSYQLTHDIMPSSYTDGYEICFKPLHANTGASTVQVGTLGSVPLKKTDGSDLISGDLVEDAYYSFRFNGTEFRLETMTSGDFAYIHSERVSAENSAAEAKQWSIGDPSEPAEHSAKYWSQQAPDHFMRRDIAAQGGIGSDVASDTVDWNSIDTAKAGCSHYLLKGSNPHGPGGSAYYHPFTFEYISKDGSGNMTQLAIGYNVRAMFIRNRYANTWTAWTEFITTDNFNTSGDARYLQLSGGTMSGSLNMDNYQIRSGTNNWITYNSTEFHVEVGNTNQSLTFKSTADFNFNSDGANDGIYLAIMGVGSGLTNLSPQRDNDVKLGISSLAYKEVNAYSYVTASDERLKDIQELGSTSWIYDLQPIAYQWKNKPSGTRYGLGAQTTYDLMPDKTANLVDKPDNSEDPWRMQPDQLIPLLLNEMKILRQRIEQLEAI